MTSGHADVGSLTYWGGIALGVVGLILAGMTVGELKRARNSVRSVTAQGKVTYAEDSLNKYGDVIGQVIEVTFTTVKGVRIKFTEDIHKRKGDFALHQEVTVHYDPQVPRDTATAYSKRVAFGRASGFAASALFCLAIFVVTVCFSHY